MKVCGLPKSQIRGNSPVLSKYLSSATSHFGFPLGVCLTQVRVYLFWLAGLKALSFADRFCLYTRTYLQIRHFFQLKNINIFLTSPKKHMLWYSLEVPHRGTSNEYHCRCFR